MMLLNFKRTVTCVAVTLLVLAFTSVGLSQEPPIENVTTVSDATVPEKDPKPALVAINVEPMQVDPVVSRDAITSKFEIESIVSKKSVDRLNEPSLLKKQDSSDDSGWHFAVAPYLFAAGISGTVGARGRTLDLDANFDNVAANLDLGLMGAFEVRKGRFVSLNDMIWVKLSSEKDTPGPLYSTAKLGVNLFIFDPEVGYRFINSRKGSVDVLAGVRVWSVETNLNVTTGALPGFDVSQRKTWAAPVVGVRGVANITQKFFLAGKFDIGGAGIGADLTTQLYGAAGYSFTKHFALLGGYRWLQVDYDDDEGFLFDTQMNGIMIGAKFSW